MDRENPLFKEFVKIAITPMLVSLSIMTLAESENEIIGFGVSVILMNIGMYFVLPFVICYCVKKNIRASHTKQLNLRVKFKFNILYMLKKSLFGLIALLVLSVSLSSAFVESAYADDHDDPIKTVLDITYQNILETRENIDDVPENANTLFSAGEEEYFEALSALEAGDTDAARDHALIAMALFEDSTEVIGEFEGFEDDDIDIPSEITGQFTFNSIFETREQISERDSEFEELQVLAELNGFVALSLKQHH